MILSQHFFRRESGPLVVALVRIFGVADLALCEDVAQDAFCRALEVWKVRGVPDNPSAWLMATAKHRALDVLRRQRTARTLAPELERRANDDELLSPIVDEAFVVHPQRDQQLRMMFSCCSSLLVSPSPVVALNRAIAVGQLEGPERGLALLYTLPERERLAMYPFYPAALAELELRCGRHDDARAHFEAALGLVRNRAERRFLEQRLASCPPAD